MRTERKSHRKNNQRKIFDHKFFTVEIKTFVCIILAELIDILIVFVFSPAIAAGNLDLPLADEPVVLVVGIVLGVPPKQMFSYFVPCVDFNQKTQYTLYNSVERQWHWAFCSARGEKLKNSFKIF